MTFVWWALACAPAPTVSPPPVSLPAPVASPAPLSSGFVGVLIAERQAVLSACVSGSLSEASAKVGDLVAAGTPMAFITSMKLNTDVATAEAEVTASKATVDDARAELRHANRHRARLAAVQEEGVIAEVELADAKRAVEKAESALIAAQATYDTRMASLQRYTTQQRECSLEAPFDGRVAHWYAPPGAWLALGAPVVRMVVPGHLAVRFAVSTAEASSLHLGQSVYIQPDRLRVRWPATIQSIAPEVEPSSQLVFVEATLESAPPQTFVGEACQVFLEMR